VANNFFKVKKGFNVEPSTNAASEAGDLRVDSADSNKLKFHNGSSEDSIPTAASSTTLTNKTIVVANNTVTTAASGNLAATELNAALAELQSDIDTRALDSDLSTHVSDTTTHGTMGAIVGTSDTQTLTNKSIDADSNTITNIENADIKAAAAIARSKLADGTADHVVINNGTGGFSSEATLAKSRGGAGADMSSVTFPSTGTIATRAAVEDLSNKTFTDPVTLEEQGSTPATPSSGDRKVYAKTDGKLYHLGADGIEKAVGSGAGGGINYHDDYECDNISKVSEYDDAASTPVDGTGGTTSVTSALETSSPLSGDSSYKLSKGASNLQGEGWAIDSDSLSFMETDSGQMLWVDFSYKTSANFVADDVKMYVYRVGSGTMEALNTFQGSSMSNSLPVAPNGARYSGWVTCSSSDTSVRLIFHCASTSDLAYDIHVDRLSIGPSAQVQAGIMSDWQSYTPNSSISTNVTWTGKWRRIGDEMEGELLASFFGANTQGYITADLPSGYSIDTNKIVAAAGSDKVAYGMTIVRDEGTDSFFGPVILSDSNTLLAGVLLASGTYTGRRNVDTSVNVPMTFASNDSVSIKFKVPILGWTSGNVMSTAELQVRTPAFLVRSAAVTGTLGALNNVIKYDTATEYKDTNNGYSASTGLYTAPATGYYEILGKYAINHTTASGYVQASIGIDGAIKTTNYKYVSGVSDSAQSISGLLYVEKGQTVGVYSSTNLTTPTYNATAALNVFSIKLVPDLTVIGVTGVNEVKESASTAIANYTITADQWGDLASVSLTPGTWDLSAQLALYSNGATTTGNVLMGIGTVSGNNGPGSSVFGVDFVGVKKSTTSGEDQSLFFAKRNVVVTTTTTYYMKTIAGSSITNLQEGHVLSARRIQ
jgi:hypothetical protein